MNSKKRKTYINIAVSTLLIGGGIYLMNEYLSSYIISISDDILTSKKNIRQIEERNNKIDDVRKNYNDIKDEIGVISDTFVKKDYEKVGDMFMDLEDIANRYSVDLDKKPSAREELTLGDGSISAAFFDLTASGDYDNLMKFMLYLDNFKYYMDLNNVQIETKIDEETKVSTIMLRAELEVYLENEKK